MSYADKRYTNTNIHRQTAKNVIFGLKGPQNVLFSQNLYFENLTPKQYFLYSWVRESIKQDYSFQRMFFKIGVTSRNAGKYMIIRIWYCWNIKDTQLLQTILYTMGKCNDWLMKKAFHKVFEQNTTFLFKHKTNLCLFKTWK